MKITYEDQNELSVLTLKGDLTGSESDRLRRTVIERLDARVRDFVLDLGGVDGIDSQGLESLLWLQDQCADRLGQIRLAACRETIDEVLRITRLAGRFECSADTPSAIQSLG